MTIKECEKLAYEREFEISQELRDNFGKYIRELRTEKGISLTQLADLTNINISDLHKIERGTKNKINPFQLKALSSVLQKDYKIFYKMLNYLEDIDFNEKGILENKKGYTKEELIHILSMYYPKVDVTLLFKKLDGVSKKQINEIFLFIDFIKEKKGLN